MIKTAVNTIHFAIYQFLRVFFADCRLMYDYRPASEGGFGKTVLLVCTNRALRMELKQALTDVGYLVEAVSSGVGGLLSLREAEPRFDWLITERAMPGAIDGRCIAYEYRFQRPLRPALFIGGAAGEAVVPEGEFLPWPLEGRDVVARVERLRGEHCPSRREAGKPRLIAATAAGRPCDQ